MTHSMVGYKILNGLLSVNYRVKRRTCSNKGFYNGFTIFILYTIFIKMKLNYILYFTSHCDGLMFTYVKWYWNYHIYEFAVNVIYLIFLFCRSLPFFKVSSISYSYSLLLNLDLNIGFDGEISITLKKLNYRILLHINSI